MRHVRTISKSSPKSASELQDLICQVLTILSNVFSMKNINIPVLGIFTGEESACNAAPTGPFA